MEKTFAEKREEYRVRYLVPIIFYTKKEGLTLSGKVRIDPDLASYFLYTLHILKEILIRGVILLVSKIRTSHE
jgi:hypothetical protein